ncbi:hypothetical protein Tco_1428966 [Tanacetum coccineum]
MSTPIDFSAFVMNHLKIDNLTQQHLVGPTINLLNGTYKSRVEHEYHFEECYKAVIDLTHVKVMKKYDYGYLEEIEVRRDDNMLHKFKEGDFLNLNLRDIEDMLLLLV